MKIKFNFEFRRFYIFFILMCFVVTCNLILFLHWIDFTPEEIQSAVPITLLNVVFLTVFFTIIDEIRRFWTIKKPVLKIRKGLEKIMRGDFKTQIPYVIGEESKSDFDAIIKCINELAVELSGVETLKTDFISNVSHEIKTPLAVIQNYGTMLQKENLSEQERREYGKAITDQTKKMSNLITNILKLNRLENQQIYPDKKKYNLTEQICESLLLFESSWEKKNITIETEIEENIFICADEELLSLVWNNLFSNAIKFTDNEGKVSVKIKKEHGKVIVEVKDSGCGISPDIGKHIFDKFYQGDTSHSTEGNGLGLTLVKKVIDIVGGDIYVQSELGEGSIFTVTLVNDDAC